MYLIKLEDYGNVLIRDLRENEDFDRYRMYVANKIGDNLTEENGFILEDLYLIN